MDWLSFFAAIVGSLAWPITVLVVALLLRKPLAGLLPLLQRLRFKDFEVDFGKRVEEIRHDVLRELPPTTDATTPPALPQELAVTLASLSPRAAVLEAWRQVEVAADDALHTLGLDQNSSRSTSCDAIRALESSDRLDRSTIRFLRELQELRNEAAHFPDFAPSEKAAFGYEVAAHALANHLKTIGAFSRDEDMPLPTNMP